VNFARVLEEVSTFLDGKMADIRFLLGLPGVDRTEIRMYFERHGMKERFDELDENTA
jgi:hypothetical protein